MLSRCRGRPSLVGYSIEPRPSDCQRRRLPRLPVVPRRARRDVGQPDAVGAELLQRLRNQLWAPVYAQHLGRAADRGQHGLQLGHEPFGGDERSTPEPPNTLAEALLFTAIITMRSRPALEAALAAAVAVVHLPGPATACTAVSG